MLLATELLVRHVIQAIYKKKENYSSLALCMKNPQALTYDIGKEKQYGL